MSHCWTKSCSFSCLNMRDRGPRILVHSIRKVDAVRTSFCWRTEMISTWHDKRAPFSGCSATQYVIENNEFIIDTVLSDFQPLRLPAQARHAISTTKCVATTQSMHCYISDWTARDAIWNSRTCCYSANFRIHLYPIHLNCDNSGSRICGLNRITAETSSCLKKTQ